MLADRVSLRRIVVFALVWVLAPTAGRAIAQTIRVDITPGHATNSFSPLHALGAGVDGQLVSILDPMWSRHNLDEMLAAGWGEVSYRLYTELSVQHWHWNPAGTWSDSGAGYWTGESGGHDPIVDSFGYRLPHRGFTHDQGNDDDYSRLDDGDLTTYWKSNPYLTSDFTREPDALHPQWVVVDLGTRRPVDAIRLSWTDPYAIAYEIQYWTGMDAIFDPAHGRWEGFPAGAVRAGTGGTVTLRLASSPIAVEYIRILMSESSNTCDTHGSSDLRNCVGYALDELGIGTLTKGTFHDLVRHVPSTHQTQTYVSSVDPWHEPSDQVKDQEQPGLDFIFTNGITRGLPVMVPVGMLYGVPEDAAAEIKYLEARSYPISFVEMGEEPDGQYVLPEDYGALYLQWATALHGVDPKLKLGGPVFQGVSPASPKGDLDVPVWPDAQGDTSFLRRFLRYIRTHGRASDYSFFSFETYPFGTCSDVWLRLLETPASMQNLMNTWAADGLPDDLPRFVTEYNVTFDSTSAFQSIGGALLHADMVGSLFAAGLSGAYFYEYEPTLLSKASGCNQWGAFGSMFQTDSHDQIQHRAAQFFSTQLMTQEWAQPVDAIHTVYPAKSDRTDAGGNVLVTSYALLRPDGQYSIMLINKDRNDGQPVTVAFHDGSGTDRHFVGPVTMVTFGSEQYVWHPNGPDGSPKPDGPARATTLLGGEGTVYPLPQASITILRGRVE
jgi:hypothetical protein